MRPGHAVSPSVPAPVRSSPRDSGYALELLERALEHYDALRSVMDGSCFLASRRNPGGEQEGLWCLLLDLRAALPRVPFRQRVALFVLLVEHRTEMEAASLLGIGRSALRKRVRGGLVRLRALLAEGCPAPGGRGPVPPPPRRDGCPERARKFSSAG